MVMKKKRTEAQIAADKLRTGRPRKSQREKQSERVMVYLTQTERMRLEELAKREGLSLSSLIMRPWREKR
jgi:hypothetical protein